MTLTITFPRNVVVTKKWSDISIYEKARFFSNNDRSNLFKAIKDYYLNVEEISVDISRILRDLPINFCKACKA